MNRSASLLAGLLVIAVRPCVAAQQPFSAFFGLWTVERVVGSASTTESQKSADAALGTTIHISADIITTYSTDDACKPRDPSVREVVAERVLETDFGTRRNDLSLPGTPVPSRTGYLDAGCASALVLDRNTLLWPMGNGYIYMVHRQSH